MASDLYKDDFSRLNDAEVRQSIETFTRISEPEAVRPRESFVLDFKEEWTTRALHTVAAFAHTFGGLLIVGVSEKDGQPDQLIGVESPGELKTSIASSIATNISPTPLYEIAECSLPSKAGRKLAVVRVRQGHQLFYLTKKGEKPIYVRNEDESVPADASQLRSLIERKAQSQSQQTLVHQRLNSLRNVVNLSRTAKLEGNNQIPTRLSVVLAPIDHAGIMLDSTVEQQFRLFANRLFAFLYRDKQIESEESRYIDYYELRWFYPIDKHETVWRITSDGDVIFASQIRISSGKELGWSLGDVIINLLFLLTLSRAFWRKTANFFGDAQLMVQLNPHDLLLTPFLSFNIPLRSPWLYSVENFNSDLQGAVFAPHLPDKPSPTTATTSLFSSGSPYGTDSEIVAHTINLLLRGLGYSANLSALRQTIEHFIQALNS